MKRLRTSSISTVVTLVLVACVSLISTLSAWTFYRAFADEQWNALTAMQQRGIGQLTISLEAPVWNLDASQIDGVLDASMRNPAVDAVTLRFLNPEISPRWRKRVQTGLPSETTARTHDRLPPAATGIIRRKGEVLGEVTLAVNANGVMSVLAAMRLRLLIGLITIDLALVAGLYLMLRWLVLAPIRAIQRFATEAEAAIGHEVPASLAGKRFIGELEHLRNAIVAMVDVLTERYGALIVSRQEISELNASLEQRVADRTNQLDVANEELQAFSYSVSHDLRAPLRGIDGWSLALQEDCGEQLDAKGHEYLRRVRSEAQRMGDLIDDLLRLSRVTQSELSKVPVDISAMAQEIIAQFRLQTPQRDVSVTIQPDLAANADVGLLRVMLENLLENAWKFTSKTTQAIIVLGQERHEDEFVFFVRDNGAGFDMEYASKLFSAFCRLHRSSEFSGTGIGLATVNRIVHRHGGRIWAKAAVNHGATFYFTLGSQP
jgi:signal transduction histidine kinase